jgi:hypothetical protein
MAVPFMPSELTVAPEPSAVPLVALVTAPNPTAVELFPPAVGRASKLVLLAATGMLATAAAVESATLATL